MKTMNYFCIFFIVKIGGCLRSFKIGFNVGSLVLSDTWGLLLNLFISSILLIFDKRSLKVLAISLSFMKFSDFKLRLYFAAFTFVSSFGITAFNVSNIFFHKGLYDSSLVCAFFPLHSLLRN